MVKQVRITFRKRQFWRFTNIRKIDDQLITSKTINKYIIPISTTRNRSRRKPYRRTTRHYIKKKKKKRNEQRNKQKFDKTCKQHQKKRKKGRRLHNTKKTTKIFKHINSEIIVSNHGTK